MHHRSRALYRNAGLAAVLRASRVGHCGPREHGQRVAANLGHIANRAVDHHARHPLQPRANCGDAAPKRRVQLSLAIDHEHITGRAVGERFSDHQDVRGMYLQRKRAADDATVRRPAAHVVIHGAALAQRVRQQRGAHALDPFENASGISVGRTHIITCAGLIAWYFPLLAVISKACGTDRCRQDMRNGGFRRTRPEETNRTVCSRCPRVLMSGKM